MNASTLFPQPYPSLSYNGSAASGSNAEHAERTTEFDAIALAANNVKLSTRYSCTGRYENIAPIPTTAHPIMGTIQCVRACTVQPYSRNPLGSRIDPTISGGRRSSGCFEPSARCDARWRRFLSENQPTVISPMIRPTVRPR